MIDIAYLSLVPLCVFSLIYLDISISSIDIHIESKTHLWPYYITIYDMPSLKKNNRFTRPGSGHTDRKSVGKKRERARRFPYRG